MEDIWKQGLREEQMAVTRLANSLWTEGTPAPDMRPVALHWLISYMQL